ncbi:MAG: DNA double-strand break repair nuclease NurA [Tissierellia bacterium]|nr:DNA double-strand break repair nuclease NurA [Tissierellia bacterium]
MDRIDANLKKSLEELNDAIKIGYKDLLAMDRTELRGKLSGSLGPISRLDNLLEEELKGFTPIVGVDGSNIRLGGNEPHFIELYRALAKPSIKELEPVIINKLYCPLILGEESPMDSTNLLGFLEVEAAMQSIEACNPKVIMMDGGLLRYIIDAGEAFNLLMEECINKEIILIGVIKDIKTTMVKELFPGPIVVNDREALFGVLDPGEVLTVEGARKHEALSSAFIRTSSTPAAIGIDCLKAQEGHMIEMARLVLSLTPESGRGAPLWLDIVDREVRLTKNECQTLLKTILEPEIYKRFAESEREQRPR